jgi:hypothetical protein
VIAATPPATPAPAGADVNIDFGRPVVALSPRTFGIDESHYGGDRNLTSDAAQRDRIRALGIGAIRLDLAYRTPGDPASGLVCYARGCDQSIPGAAWVDAARSVGAEPSIKVRISTSMPRESWTTDAANTVTFLNTGPGALPVRRWIIGNEPDSAGIDADEYAQAFIDAYRAMKAVDPSIAVGGPATASYNREYIEEFLRLLHDNGIAPDFVDWHQYGRGGDVEKDDATMLSSAVESYERNGRDLRRLLAEIYGEDVASGIEIEVGEWNLSWSGDERQLTHFGTVWTASAIGHMLNAGANSRLYASKNGTLGLLCDEPDLSHGSVTRPCAVNDPLPAYHGMSMFTGGSSFRRFGTSLVASSTSLPGVEVYASAQPQNIVVINKDAEAVHSATFSLDGAAVAGVAVWRIGPGDDAPVYAGAVPLDGDSFSYDLAPRTVYTFLVNP